MISGVSNKKRGAYCTHLGDVHNGVYDLWHVGLHGLDRPSALQEAVVVVVPSNLADQEQRSGQLLRAIYSSG